MAIVSAEKFVQAARDNGYAVGGFNTNNLEWTQAILRAAEAKQAPVLIQTSMGAAKYMGGYKLCKALIEELVESMGITVPVAIHLDHGHYNDALECIRVGYTSVMFDGSHLPVEENLEKARKVVGMADPRVSMLSFSTKGSASTPEVDKVVEAVNILKERNVDFKFDGELQLDASIVPSVAEKKAPGSNVAGKANILIFPDLQAANIGYKLVQRFSGADALGPLIQGLAKPVHDLSRGCSAQDVVDVAAIAAIESI